MYLFELWKKKEDPMGEVAQGLCEIGIVLSKNQHTMTPELLQKLDKDLKETSSNLCDIRMMISQMETDQSRGHKSIRFPRMILAFRCEQRNKLDIFIASEEVRALLVRYNGQCEFFNDCIKRMQKINKESEKPSFLIHEEDSW